MMLPLNELACSLDIRPNFINDCRSTGNTLARRTALDVLEYLTLVDSTIEPAEDLGALVVSIVREIIVFVAKVAGISIIRIFKTNSMFVLNSYMWTWGFKVGAPGIVFRHPRQIHLNVRMSAMNGFTNEERILAGIPVLEKSTAVECISARMIHFGSDVPSTSWSARTRCSTAIRPSWSVSINLRKKSVMSSLFTGRLSSSGF
jgi:hypothetical protein